MVSFKFQLAKKQLFKQKRNSKKNLTFSDNFSDYFQELQLENPYTARPEHSLANQILNQRLTLPDT